MAGFEVRGARMCGLAAAVPRSRVANRDLALLPERERPLFVQTTGIETRRVAPASQCASDLCHAAAEALLQALGWPRDTIDLLVLVTQTPDHTIPGTASQLQQRLGLGKQVVAIDLNQGCAGYVYGLSVAAALLATGGFRRALLLVGDAITHTLSPEDKSTVPIFSDAGSATALAHDPAAPALHFDLQTDGGGYQAICIPQGGARQPYAADNPLEDHGAGIRRAAQHLAMQGIDVFNFALAEVAPNVRSLLARAGKSADEADAFVFHQANLLLNESIRRKLGLPAEKVPYSLRDFGNTSSATIPVTMVHCLGEPLRRGPLRLVLSGFGVGLSWGSAWLETDRITCLPMIEC